MLKILKKTPGIQSITGRAGARSPIILYQAEWLSQPINTVQFVIVLDSQHLSQISVIRVKQQQQIKIRSDFDFDIDSEVIE